MMVNGKWTTSEHTNSDIKSHCETTDEHQRRASQHHIINATAKQTFWWKPLSSRGVEVPRRVASRCARGDCIAVVRREKRNTPRPL